nr:IS30 family transposase [Microbacterium bovistercoris]
MRTARDWDHGVRRSNNARIYPDGRRIDYNTGVTSLVVPGQSPSLAVVEAVLHPRFLTITEREQIADLHRHGASLRAIGRQLGRPASTIKREIDAHGTGGAYRPHAAHRTWAGSRARPKPSKLAQHGRLRDYVAGKLQLQWSPEQIRNSLIKEFPDDEGMRVSTETIYQAIYVQARGGLRREVADALRTRRTRRKPHKRPDQRTSRFVDEMVMISDRPAEIDDRAVPGHWEGDLIVGTRSESAIVTLVERTTRYVMLGHLPGGHTAEEVRDVLVPLIGTLPEHLRGSLTWDQGCEMAAHKQFSVATGVPVYFCDPHSPWQRGSNENTNGLLRQYFPKGTDLSVFGPEDLENVAHRLNSRPRKTLDWDTPAERLRDLLTTS